MRRLFFRLYTVVGVVLVASVALVALLLPSERTVTIDRQIQGMTGAWPADVSGSFDGLPHDEAAAALGERLDLPVSVLPEAAVIGAVGDFARRNLGQGKPVVQLHDAGPAIYVPLAGQPFVAVLRPGPPPPPWRGPRGVVLAVVVLFSLGGAVFALVRPIERQLEAVSTAAQQIRLGELDARAAVLRDDASGQLAGTFNEMAAKVQTILETRKTLLHGVSHELRTPLARLRFAVELLVVGEGQDRRVEEILGDVTELEELVSELMRYSQLEGDADLTTESVKLDDLVGALVEEARRLRADVEVRDELSAVPPVDVDQRLVQRAISNLINNAVRYAEARVVVRTELLPGVIAVHVDDDGPGVAEADRQRIFEPFVRGDTARTRDRGGIGLGLALARKGARACGGDIRVETSPLGGARFTFELELPEQEAMTTLQKLTGRLAGRR